LRERHENLLSTGYVAALSEAIAPQRRRARSICLRFETGLSLTPPRDASGRSRPQLDLDARATEVALPDRQRTPGVTRDPPRDLESAPGALARPPAGRRDPRSPVFDNE